jgi:protein TonB
VALHAGAITIIAARPTPEETGFAGGALAAVLAEAVSIPVVFEAAEAAKAEDTPKPPDEPRLDDLKPDETGEVAMAAKPPLPQPLVEEQRDEQPIQPQSSQAAVVTAAPAEAVPQQAVRAALTSWTTRVSILLERRKRYPAAATRGRVQGVATVAFEIDRSGKLLSFQLVSSSGHVILDEEAQDLLRRIGTFPPLPVEISSATLSVSVPIRFSF